VRLLPNRPCSRRPRSSMRAGTRFARAHRAILSGPPQQDAIRSVDQIQVDPHA
jgi:hypothetical protein